MEGGLRNKRANAPYILWLRRAVAYLGAWCDARVWRDNKHLWFSAFPNVRKVGKFAASIERPKAMCTSFGGFAP